MATCQACEFFQVHFLVDPHEVWGRQGQNYVARSLMSDSSLSAEHRELWPSLPGFLYPASGGARTWISFLIPTPLFILKKVAQTFHPNSAKILFFQKSSGGIEKGTQSCCEDPGFPSKGLPGSLCLRHSPKLSLALFSKACCPFLFLGCDFPINLGE